MRILYLSAKDDLSDSDSNLFISLYKSGAVISLGDLEEEPKIEDSKTFNSAVSDFKIS